MNLRPAISAPLPWLTIAAGRLFGRKSAREKLKHFLFPRSLKFTKFGRNYVIALLILGIAAINTGNNLLYLVAASLMSLIIISGILSESTLRKLTAIRSFLGVTAFKNTPLTVPTRLRNSKKYLPSYSFSIKDIDIDGIETTGSYIIKLEAGRETSAYPSYIFKKRGYITLKGITIGTSFPFGLFTKGKIIFKDETILVYPAVMAINKQELASTSISGAASLRRKSFGTELYGLKEYTSIDDARHIHWKASARALKVLTKEYQEEIDKNVLIVFENFSCDELVFEERVDYAASLVTHYVKSGYSVGLKTLTSFIGYGAGQFHYDKIMTELALIRQAETKGEASVRVIS